jgi:hypothetical protein
VKLGDEAKRLQSLRNTLTTRNNLAAETIKDIVFEHYKHFIETSKEISSITFSEHFLLVKSHRPNFCDLLDLEREIYQLSTLLSDQKNVIESLMEMSGQDKKSSSNASVHSGTSSSQSQLHSLMGKMDGVAVSYEFDAWLSQKR